MDFSRILDLFGYSVYSPQIDRLLKQCDAACDNKDELKRYDSIKSKSLGVDLWFWWKKYYREQIAAPQETVQPEDSIEVVLYEARFTPQGLTNVPLPFGLSFPATPESVRHTLGKEPFSKAKNVAKNPYWSYYIGQFWLLVIFTADGKEVQTFKIVALRLTERQKIDLLENLKQQKKNIQPERIPDIEALAERLPTVAWERRMKSGDEQFTVEAIEASNQIFEAFIEGVCKATKTSNAKAIYTAVTKATKAFNKFARQHRGVIETMEREEIIEFFNRAVLKTGFQFDPSFDLTEEYRSW